MPTSSSSLPFDEVLRRHRLARGTRGVARRAPAWLRRLWGREVGAMTLPGLVLVDPDAWERVVAGEAPDLVAHEAAHLRQWTELGPVRFLARYLTAYLAARLVGAGHREAYLAIPLERAARAAEPRAGDHRCGGREPRVRDYRNGGSQPGVRE